MESLQQDFDELRQRLKRGRNLEMTGDDPVFYLIFRPEQMLIVKQRLKQWRAKLELEGWKVHLFSMADAVHQILQNHQSQHPGILFDPPGYRLKVASPLAYFG